MRDNCVMCGCAILENVGGCGCKCHYLTEKLVELNDGDRERTRRELKEEKQNDEFEKIFSRAFSIPGVGIGVPMKTDEFMKFLGKHTRDGNIVNVGTASGRADPYTMSTEDLIKHEVFTGIQTNVLPQGFRLGVTAHKELTYVLEGCKTGERVSICIAYLAGYNRGYDFGKIDK